MECRHQIFSMAHSLRGEVAIDGEVLCFDGGTGYWEGDRGISFPSSYLWAQCNTFPENCAFMASVAEIPFCGLRFRGCICAVLWNGKEYRFATYRGVRIPTAERDRVVLSQSRLRLDLQIRQTLGHTLASPILGKMSGRIRECCNVPIRLRLWEGDRQLFDLSSPEGMFEFQK